MVRAQARQAVLDELCVDSPAQSSAASVDWSDMPVADLVGTELEWSTICIESRKTKQHRCLFCGRCFAGGPAQIRDHLDEQIKPRHVSPPLVRTAFDSTLRSIGLASQLKHGWTDMKRS